jgi:hypothetical protein
MINTQAISSMVKGTSMVSATTQTIPTMRKTNNPFVGKVVKVQTLNGVIGYDYQNSINNLAKKEGVEANQAQPRKWGTLSKDRIFVHHTNKQGEEKTYLRMKVEKSNNIKYINIETNEEVDVEELRPFFPTKKKSSTQSNLQGEVIERDVDLANVKELKIKGMTIS